MSAHGRAAIKIGQLAFPSWLMSLCPSVDADVFNGEIARLKQDDILQKLLVKMFITGLFAVGAKLECPTIAN